MPVKHRTPRRRHAGLSLVELLVGIAVGLFVLAGATMLISTQLGDNRRLLLETQVQQDLRATLDIITRELRRSGTTFDGASTYVWFPGAVGNPIVGPTELTISDGGQEVLFQYAPSGLGEVLGFRRDDDRIRALRGTAWQELTDPSVMRVTDFNVSEEDQETDPLPCPRMCPDGTADCWPTMVVRSLIVRIEVESVADPLIKRGQTSRVRLRNDLLSRKLGSGPTPACPA